MPANRSTHPGADEGRVAPSYFCHACGAWHWEGGEDFLEHMPHLAPQMTWPQNRVTESAMARTFARGKAAGMTESLRIINAIAGSGSNTPVDAQPIINRIRETIAGEVVRCSN